jgi:hypothetical protein
MIVADIFKENHRFSEKTAHPGPRSVVGAANLATSRRGSRTDFRSEIPKEMKMTNKPGVDPGTTEVPFRPIPAPVPSPGSTGTAAAPKITITNTDKRQIDNLRLSATFLINSQPYYDYEDHGTFNQVGVDGLSGENGKWNGSQWVGNFLHTESSQSTQAFLQTLNQALTQVSVQTGGNEDN